MEQSVKEGNIILILFYKEEYLHDQIKMTEFCEHNQKIYNDEP